MPNNFWIKYKSLTYEEAIHFHGHDGPFLALGYRAGMYARQVLKPKGIMGLECIVEVRNEKPWTCAIDGIQCATCCTPGKGILKIKETTEKVVTISFKNRKTQETLNLKIKDEIFEKFKNIDDLKKGAQEVLNTPIDNLFLISS